MFFRIIDGDREVRLRASPRPRSPMHAAGLTCGAVAGR